MCGAAALTQLHADVGRGLSENTKLNRRDDDTASRIVLPTNPLTAVTVTLFVGE